MARPTNALGARLADRRPSHTRQTIALPSPSPYSDTGTTYEFVIILQTAQALDLTVTLSPQAAADEGDRKFADVAVWHVAEVGTVIDPPQFRRCLDANLSHSRRKAWREGSRKPNKIASEGSAAT